MTKYERGDIFFRSSGTLGGIEVDLYWIVTNPDALNAYIDQQGGIENILNSQAGDVGRAYVPGYKPMTIEEYQEYMQSLQQQDVT